MNRRPRFVRSREKVLQNLLRKRSRPDPTCDDDPWSTLVENLWSSGMQVSYTIAPAMHTALCFTLLLFGQLLIELRLECLRFLQLQLEILYQSVKILRACAHLVVTEKARRTGVEGSLARGGRWPDAGVPTVGKMQCGCEQLSGHPAAAPVAFGAPRAPEPRTVGDDGAPRKRSDTLWLCLNHSRPRRHSTSPINSMGSVLPSFAFLAYR